jgi:hypothetical protein
MFTFEKKIQMMKSFFGKYSHWLIMVSILCFSYGARAQFNVYPLAGTTINPAAEGLIYALPRNTVTVTISVEKSEIFKGPFADFAGKYLGLQNVVNADAVRYSIKGVDLSIGAEPDPGQLYFIEFDKKAKGAEIGLVLSEKGILSGFSQVVHSKNNDEVAEKTFGNDQSQLFIDLLKPTLLEKVDTIVRRISVDTTTIEEKVVRRSVSEKSTEQMAKETAETIRKIDENIFSLITGYQEVNYSKESLEFMISELKKVQNEYLSLFKGTTRYTTSNYSFYITPGETDEGILETLCKFSQSAGIQPKNSPSGENINLTISPLNISPVLPEFTKQRNLQVKKAHGLYYRIPQQSKISVTSGYNVLLDRTEMISQLGKVTFLPAGNYSEINFSPLTGAIRMISIR